LECQTDYADSKRLPEHCKTDHPANISNQGLESCRCEICWKYFNTLSTLTSHTSQSHRFVRLRSCVVCDKWFGNKQHYTEHMKNSHANSTFTCRFCGAKFTFMPSLRLHMRIHSDENPYLCQYCDRRYGKREQFLDHINMHVGRGKKTYGCVHCGKQFRWPFRLRDHLLESHSDVRPHCCDICGKMFVSISRLNAHKKTHADKSFLCEFCNRKFVRSQVLRSHLMTHTGDRPYVCCECGKGYVCPSNLKEHLAVHSDVKPCCCDFCGKRCISVLRLNQHKKCHEKTCPCTYCGKMFVTVSVARQHAARCYKNPEKTASYANSLNNAGKCAPCTFCGKILARAYYAKQHMSRCRANPVFGATGND